MTRHFLSTLDISAAEFTRLLERAREWKRLRGDARQPQLLSGKTIALVMEKASTRTRISFEVAVRELGGHPLSVAGRDLQLGRDEPLSDTARVLSRYVHGVVLRTHGHDRIEALASSATVPVINALTDKFHPCQILADLMTVIEHRDAGLRGLRVAWIGDGNNMANSWMQAASQLDFELVIACPDGYQPAQDVLDAANARSRDCVRVTHDVRGATAGAHVVTTDVWASMGQEGEAEARRKAFKGFCVTSELMSRAARDAIFLHCLPAHRGEEVDADVLEGPASRIWDEAENRLHAQKALLELLFAASIAPAAG